ncbi:multimeric flavodoxin WrbA [Levilactobacillus senmaizukei DSM 21775 = NBRC 103853]|uniref:Multimeric flavodoxin WrbA n=1 Tax=Levilactobacillus senmaizukei DSM 21775 = NBRC 103853 TaxID=1423803 RepID=A0A0R2DF61_9LACO|nr:flavodoxin family protein [Levilactobacillus senmaizukei]KRN02672.1 multimeric flavodoxin WrbA [Levilactobacillus senmaizukei DSM 21775 = NBRC 103853]
MTTLFINGSPRRHGNTATLGRRLLADLDHTTIHLADYRLNFEQDQRETNDPQIDQSDDFETLMDQVRVSETLVLGTPVYWYGMTGQLKVFMDRWFDSYSADFPFAKKQVYLLIVGADQPEVKATGITQAVRNSCEWLQMDFRGTLTVTADGIDDVANMEQLPPAFTHMRSDLKHP